MRRRSEELAPSEEASLALHGGLDGFCALYYYGRDMEPLQRTIVAKFSSLILRRTDSAISGEMHV